MTSPKPIAATRRVPWLTIACRMGFAIGAALLLIEGYDAFVTPGIDWGWILLAIIQMFLSRPRQDGAAKAGGVEASLAPSTRGHTGAEDLI